MTLVVGDRGARGRVARRMEHSQNAHVRVAGVLEAMEHERRQVDARPGTHLEMLVADVVDAFPLENVNDLVVRVAVLGRAARRDRADELCHVEAADVLVDEVAELPVRRRGERLALVEANGDAPVRADAEVTLGRRDRDEEKFVRSIDRPGANRIVRCSSRSQPWEASIVTRTSAVSPPTMCASTSPSATT